MRFFVARFDFYDGDWSHPWTVWAPDYGAAVARLTGVEPFSVAKQLHIKERTAGEATSFYGHDENAAALEHVGVMWDSE